MYDISTLIFADNLVEILDRRFVISFSSVFIVTRD